MSANPFRDRFVYARKQAGFKQETIAAAMGVSGGTIAQVEVGRTKMLKADNALRAAEACGVRVEWLVFGEEPMKPEPEEYSRNALALAQMYDEMPADKKIQAREFMTYLAQSSRPSLTSAGEELANAITNAFEPE